MIFDIRGGRVTNGIRQSFLSLYLFSLTFENNFLAILYGGRSPPSPHGSATSCNNCPAQHGTHRQIRGETVGEFIGRLMGHGRRRPNCWKLRVCRNVPGYSGIATSSTSSAEVKAEISPLLSGRCGVIPYGTRVAVAVWRLSEVPYPCNLFTLLTYLPTTDRLMLQSHNPEVPVAAYSLAV